MHFNRESSDACQTIQHPQAVRKLVRNPHEEPSEAFSVLATELGLFVLTLEPVLSYEDTIEFFVREECKARWYYDRT